MVANKAESRATGGGIYKQLPLSPLEEAVANLLQFQKQLNPEGVAQGVPNTSYDLPQVEENIVEAFGMVSHISSVGIFIYIPLIFYSFQDEVPASSCTGSALSTAMEPPTTTTPSTSKPLRRKIISTPKKKW